MRVGRESSGDDQRCLQEVPEIGVALGGLANGPDYSSHHERTCPYASSNRRWGCAASAAGAEQQAQRARESRVIGEVVREQFEAGSREVRRTPWA